MVDALKQPRGRVMKGKAVGPDERKNAPTFTQAHVAYLEKTFRLPEVAVLATKNPADMGMYVGHEQVINHIRSLLKES